MAVHILAGKRIAGHEGDQHVQERAHHGVEQRVAIAGQDPFVGQDGLVALDVKAHRPQLHPAAVDGQRLADGGGKHVDQRIQRRQAKQGEDDIIDDGEHSTMLLAEEY